MYHLREEGFMATLLFGACLLGFFIYSKKDKAYPFGFQTNANCCDDNLIYHNSSKQIQI